jgi:hypothetical protein
MLVLLPPSEGKTPAVRGRSLDLTALSRPALTPVRQRVLDALVAMCRVDAAAAMEALGLGPTQFDLIVQNAELPRAATRIAGEVYTGVLYSALDYPALSGQDRRRANRRLVVVSALFGLVALTDRIPAYRLSGGSRLPGLPALPGLWREAVTAELEREPGLVVDMLSTPYTSFVSLPRRSVTVKVWQPGPGGHRTAASHFNKATKGHLARALARADEPRTPLDLLAAVREAGFDAGLEGHRLDVMRVE